MNGSERIQSWPEEAREAAQLVIKQYGEPDESTESELIWHRPGPWKRIVASKSFDEHDFPAPHTDSVESVIDYRVPPEKVSEIIEFDGSVVVERTVGEGLALLVAVQSTRPSSLEGGSATRRAKRISSRTQTENP